MTLLIKGMACCSCTDILKQEFSNLGFEIIAIKFGRIVIKDAPKLAMSLGIIKSMLKKNGFDLLFSNTQETAEKIKELVEISIKMQHLNCQIKHQHHERI